MDVKEGIGHEDIYERLVKDIALFSPAALYASFQLSTDRKAVKAWLYGRATLQAKPSKVGSIRHGFRLNTLTATNVVLRQHLFSMGEEAILVAVGDLLARIPL